ncbi:hypothetical protein GCM10009801_28170 [Streptomyces albiaxialis]|uniref:Uncharacterized protein n=1 Tax=Streptomyces albiaxialis TaxID=329523 RepID=A0ABN2VXK5_9ACTN
MTDLPTVELTFRGELAPPEEGDTAACVSLSPHGEPVALWTAPADHGEQIAKDILPNGVGVPRTRLDGGVPMRFVTYGPEPVVTALETALAVPRAQPLSGGRVLVVGARCVYHPEEGPERNAEIHGADGRLLARGTLGDGIAGIRTDVADGIWVSYFDEGIFGNNGWGGPDGPEPIGSDGLVRFADDLTPDRPLPGDGPWGLPAETPRVALESTTVWTSFHNMRERVLVRFDPSEGAGPRRGWSLEGTGGGWAVPLGRDRTVAQVGGEDRHDVLTYTTLEDDGRAVPGARYRLALPGGGALGRFSGHGHAGVLHVFSGTTWWSADLSEPARERRTR